MKEPDSQLPSEELSPEILEILEDESKEAEVQAAIDAAAEEGIIVTREQAAEMLIDKLKKQL